MVGRQLRINTNMGKTLLLLTTGLLSAFSHKPLRIPTAREKDGTTPWKELQIKYR